MPKLKLDAIPPRVGSSYPAPFHEKSATRARRSLSKAGGLTEFGVNLLELPPGAWSSQRHWHTAEDEFVYVLAGEVTLVTDAGEQLLRAGDCAAFPKGDRDAHHVINKSSAPATRLEVGTSHDDDVCTYPDIDMKIDSRVGQYTHFDGTAYPDRR
jgi:uncharacterized cupin superfamily protein